MKKTKILYWVFTGLFAIMMFGSAIPDVFSQPIAIQGMHTNLGYPLYLIPFIGIAKWLGVVAILIPGYPRIKEWAYAGLFFDLIGATYSVISSGVNQNQWGFMIIPIGLGVLSYIYYHKSYLRLPSNLKSSAVRLQYGQAVNNF
jgi:hypothetical protein